MRLEEAADGVLPLTPRVRHKLWPYRRNLENASLHKFCGIDWPLREA